MPAVQSGRVCIFGAGGPVGVSATQALQDDCVLRLTDIRTAEDILAENKPQAPFAPMPSPPEAPHEWRVVDIGDYDQVLEAAQGMDALVNAAVVRWVFPESFRVNVIGAYNVMKAAVACGIRRVIHTGPRRPAAGFDSDYWRDFGVPDDVPIRVGSEIYAHTKLLAGELVRVFAEQHGLEVICLLFGYLKVGDGRDMEEGEIMHPSTVSWEDAGRAFRCGLRVERLPRPYEVFHICARMPHGKYDLERSERLLGWVPEDDFDALLRRPGT